MPWEPPLGSGGEASSSGGDDRKKVFEEWKKAVGGEGTYSVRNRRTFLFWESLQRGGGILGSG